MIQAFSCMLTYLKQVGMLMGNWFIGHLKWCLPPPSDTPSQSVLTSSVLEFFASFSVHDDWNVTDDLKINKDQDKSINVKNIDKFSRTNGKLIFICKKPMETVSCDPAKWNHKVNPKP